MAVAGGTGVLGARIVEAVRNHGATPVVIARSQGVDLTTGAGLDRALDGVDVVVDASNVTTLRTKPAIAFFEAACGQLLAAEQRAGVRHHLAVSIVGCDRVDVPYYLGKRRQEELVRAGGMPWTIVRATQFHEFAGQLLERARGPVALVPKMLTQPVAAHQLAELLVRVALGEPQGLAPDVGGPEQHQLPDLARRVLDRDGSRRRVLAVPVPGRTGRQIGDGGLLTGEGATILDETFDTWLGVGRQTGA
ncbi:3-beta hydroxysteroid dehydrogenase [Nocardioides silvaticus]|uniref:3-beta hydroxysteroid dehydrogenase n=1 Tax=Nocardioides silvaticus TaxID=2201891 RepID=A0A316TMC4_9ACTN|nr:3-beta hydroxysteroid dehydrogenase [Nocardioides silvaticus]